MVKKILASLMSAVVCIVPCSENLSVSADAIKYKTYSYYFDASANTYIETFNANLSYNSNSTMYIRNGDGNLKGTFKVNDIGITSSSRKTYIEYSNNSPSNLKGCLGYITFNTTSTISNFNITLILNDRGNSLDKSTVAVSKILMGDVNQDGLIAQEDIQLMNEYVLGKTILNEAQLRAADVNGDGELTSTDSLCVQKYISGVTTSVLG